MTASSSGERPEPTTQQRLRLLERRYSLVVFLNWFAVILAGGTLVMLSQLVLLFAFSLPAFLLYAVLGGLARALGSGALDAWYVEALQAADAEVDLRPRLARIGTVELLALGTGSLLGAGLSALLVILGLGSPLAAVILASLVLHLLTLVVTWRLIEDAPRHRASVPAALKVGLVGLPAALRAASQTVRASAWLPWLLLLEVVAGVTVGASETFWQPFFTAHFHLGGASTTVLGVLLGGCFLAGMLGNLASGTLLRLAGGRAHWLGAGSQLVQAAALLALAWPGATALWLAAGLFWLTYFARTAFSSPFLALYNGQVSDDRRSLMLSVLSVAFFVGVSLGNLGLGAVSAQWSIAWAWTLTAGVVLLSAGAFPRLRAGARS